MFWPGKLAIAVQTFSASVSNSTASAAAPSGSSCSTNCVCKCKCCRFSVQKFVTFDPDAAATPIGGNGVQKMLRLSTTDLLLLLRTAQDRENFWSNQYYKVDLSPDFEALGAAFQVGKNTLNLLQLKQIMDTITTGYRRALAGLSGSESHGALTPKAATESCPGLRCTCAECRTLPWSKLEELETHQWMHKPSENFHCRICYRLFFIQHTLLSHQTRRTKGGQLIENAFYKQLLATQQQQEQLETESLQVEQLDVPVAKGLHLDFEAEVEMEVKTPPKQRIEQRQLKTQCSRRWSCSSCSRSFLTRSFYLKHLRRIRKLCRLRLRRFRCSSCKWRFQLESSLKQHVSQFHVLNYSCLVCSLPCESRCCVTHRSEECIAAKRKYTRMRLKQGLPPLPPAKPPSVVNCEVCHREYESIIRLRAHLKRVHSKEADILCDMCGKCFYSKQEVEEHVRKKHLKRQSFYCEPCDLILCGNYNRHADSIRHVENLTRLAKLQGKLPADAVVKKHVPTVKVVHCRFCDRHIRDLRNYKKHCVSRKHKMNVAAQRKKRKKCV